MKSNVLLLVVALAATLSVAAACQKKEGPMEKAGKALDDAASEVGDAAQDAAEKVEEAVEGDH